MLRIVALWLILLAALFCASAGAQQPDLPDAPQQQPQAQPPAPQPPPADDASTQEKKPESKIKRTLKRGKPNCMHVGGVEKCWPAPGEEKDGDVGDEGANVPRPKVPESQPLPRSASPDESSSKVPLETPHGEAAAPSDVQELHAYNPHKADKNVEVGDYYFKRTNYRAAESRYAEALEYMPNHAEAIYKLAWAQDKLGKAADARANYEKYLKILPGGPFAEPAKKALARLSAQAKETTSPSAQKHP